ncbi:hypothetical protein [Enhydrobacter sp.]|jgi:hypothetical protein|uniref:hypothetical protein n=1 Tax=Enhydrobacter sp. TaxID=1894999 RepID=UPI002622179F|nr:hypothetical protein [Enhydrobacter sp.]WIM09510.1 MAG: hypothetical protein OJF58_000461 [Enhydrobacter sp.]
MDAQLPLPAGWAIRSPMNVGDPRERLEALARDKQEAKVEIRRVLDRFAEKHGLAPREIERAAQGYVDDLLDDAAFEREQALAHAIEADEET